MVKALRSQSTEMPSFFCCCQIRPPYSSTHLNTSSTNASLPKSWRDLPSLPNFFSTTVCVAIPAWSVPGTHSALRPFMRWKRMIESWMALVRAWPMCRAPVTFGGGMTMTKGSLSESISGLKKPHSCHQSYQAASTYLCQQAQSTTSSVVVSFKAKPELV